MKAKLKNAKIAPKKLNLVADLIRGAKATEAVNILRFTPKKAAKIILPVLESAIANAENNLKQDKEKLIVKEVIVNKGFSLRRYIPQSRGRAHPINKFRSHLKIELALSE